MTRPLSRSERRGARSCSGIWSTALPMRRARRATRRRQASRGARTARGVGRGVTEPPPSRRGSPPPRLMNCASPRWRTLPARWSRERAHAESAREGARGHRRRRRRGRRRARGGGRAVRAHSLELGGAVAQLADTTAGSADAGVVLELEHDPGGGGRPALHLALDFNLSACRVASAAARSRRRPLLTTGSRAAATASAAAAAAAAAPAAARGAAAAVARVARRQRRRGIVGASVG